MFFVPLHHQKTRGRSERRPLLIRITTIKVGAGKHPLRVIKRKGKKMKKLINRWLKSQAYTEYCINMARMYNFRPAN
jgi:hypothetical protein